MPTTSKQWEVRFVIGLSRDSDGDGLDDVYIARLFGETVEALRQEVCAYLKEHQPNYFETFGDHIAGGNSYKTALIPRKGPDYQSRAMVDKQLQLPLLEAVVREAEDYLLNDLLQRGWQILALEYKGEVSRIGELTNRKAIFVLGHADFPAALATLVARDFYYRHTYS